MIATNVECQDEQNGTLQNDTETVAVAVNSGYVQGVLPVPIPLWSYLVDQWGNLGHFLAGINTPGAITGGQNEIGSFACAYTGTANMSASSNADFIAVTCQGRDY